jgi:hypothetical protein
MEPKKKKNCPLHEEYLGPLKPPEKKKHGSYIILDIDLLR